jgi:hypothetical protein
MTGAIRHGMQVPEGHRPLYTNAAGRGQMYKKRGRASFLGECWPALEEEESFNAREFTNNSLSCNNNQRIVTYFRRGFFPRAFWNGVYFAALSAVVLSAGKNPCSTFRNVKVTVKFHGFLQSLEAPSG